MGAFVSGLALALFAVNYGWVPASRDTDNASEASDGYEYVVQLDAEGLRALAEGRVEELSSSPPPELRRIDRVKVVVGSEPPPRELSAVDRTSPRRIAASTGPVRQTVAKPVTPDWLPPRDETPSDPQRRTSYQNPPGNVLTDAAQDLGRATRQTGRDLRDGTVGLFGGLRDGVTAAVEGTANAVNNTLNIGNEDYYNQRRPAAAVPPNGNPQSYVPFSYENPSPTELSAPPSRGPSQAPPQFGGAAPTPVQFTAPATPNTRPPTGQGGPELAQPNPATNAGDIATQFGGNTNASNFPRNDDNPRLAPVDRFRGQTRLTDSDRGFTRDPSISQPADNGMNRTPPNDFRQPPGGFNDSGFNNRDMPRSGTNNSPSMPPQQDQWDFSRADQNFVSNPNNTPPLSTPQFGAAPSRPQQQFAQRPPLQSAGGQAPPQSTDVNAWAGGAAVPSTTSTSQQMQSTDAEQDPPNPLEDWTLGVLLLASVAGNLYVVTGYLDVRNKYRAALRRLPAGLQDRLAA